MATSLSRASVTGSDSEILHFSPVTGAYAASQTSIYASCDLMLLDNNQLAYIVSYIFKAFADWVISPIFPWVVDLDLWHVLFEAFY